MVVERPLEDPGDDAAVLVGERDDLGAVGARDLDRAIAALGIEHHELVDPGGDGRERALEIRLLVAGRHQHGQRRAGAHAAPASR
jgi:hypothetical protein